MALQANTHVRPFAVGLLCLLRTLDIKGAALNIIDAFVSLYENRVVHERVVLSWSILLVGPRRPTQISISLTERSDDALVEAVMLLDLRLEYLDRLGNELAAVALLPIHVELAYLHRALVAVERALNILRDCL